LDYIYIYILVLTQDGKIVTLPELGSFEITSNGKKYFPN